MHDTALIDQRAPSGQLGLPATLFALGFGALIQGGLEQLPALLMAAGAFAGGIATLLPAITTFLDRREQRRRRRPGR